MTASRTHIEDLQARLEAISKREQGLIRALDEALAQADRKLLDEVRSVAIEHEARRAIILTELQSLATRIGAFPVQDAPIEQISYEHLDLTAYGQSEGAPAEREAPKGGDWRQAAENIGDDLDYDLATANAAERLEKEFAARRRA